MQLVGGVAGAAVGFAFGNPQIGWMIGSAIGGYFTTVDGPKLGEARTNTAQDGGPRTILYGTHRVGGNVIAQGPLIEGSRKERQGKGPSVRVPFRKRTWAFGLGEPVAAITRIWINNQLKYDVRPESAIPGESAEFEKGFRFYAGAEDQMPDPALEGIFGAGNTPAYRGTAYLVFPEYDVTDTAGALPAIEVEAVSAGGVVVNEAPPSSEPRSYLANIAGLIGGGEFIDPPDSAPNLGIVPSGYRSVYGIISVSYGEGRYTILQDGFPVSVVELTGPANLVVAVNVVAGVRIQVKIENLNPLGGNLLTQFYAYAYPKTREDYGYVDTSGGHVTLEHIVRYIVSLSSLNLDLVETTDLRDVVVRGFPISGDYTHGDVIRSLAQVYMFDCPEYDGKIRFVRRGGPVLRSIPTGELIDDDETIETQLRDEARQYPRKVHLQYQPAETDYTATKQTSERISANLDVVGEQTIQVPINFEADEAAQRAAILHKAAWATAEGTAEFGLPLHYLGLTPADCIGLPVGGKLTRLRLDEVRISDGMLACKATVDRQSAYTSNVTGIPAVPATPPPPTLPGVTQFVWLNLPALTLSDDRVGYRVAVGGLLPGWYGALLERSADGGATWEEKGTITAGAEIGELVSDDGDTLVVRFPEGVELEFSTPEELARGFNALAIRSGADASPEIVQFAEADEVEPGEWLLTGVVRGQLRTPVRDWTAGASVVVLQDTVFIEDSPLLIGQSLMFRATSLGTSSDSSQVHSVTWSPARVQQEWAVSDLNTVLDGASLIVSWTPAPRLEAGTVHSINFDGYLVTVTDGTTTRAVETRGSDTAVDVSGMSGIVTVTVVGLNRITGPGLPVQTSVGITNFLIMTEDGGALLQESGGRILLE